MPHQPPQVFSIRGLRLYFPALERWVAQSVSLPSCSSRFICMRMWDRSVRDLPPRPESSPPGCPSRPLLLVWTNVYSLTPWLSNFHMVWFSVSSGGFLFLNLLLTFFWLCKEVQYIYLRIHLGLKSSRLSFLVCKMGIIIAPS